MEPKNEFPPANYSPEQMAKLEMSRVKSDAKLGDGDAVYKFNEKGERENLILTEVQKSEVGNHEMQAEKARVQRMISLASGEGIYNVSIKSENSPKSIPVKVKFRNRDLVLPYDHEGRVVRDDLISFIGREANEGDFELLRLSDFSAVLSKVKQEGITVDSDGKGDVATISLSEIESIERLDK